MITVIKTLPLSNAVWSFIIAPSLLLCVSPSLIAIMSVTCVPS